MKWLGFLLSFAIVFSANARELKRGKPLIPMARSIGVAQRIFGVSWRIPPEGERETLALRTRVFEGDRILTKTSRLHLNLGEGLAVSQGENSTFTLEKHHKTEHIGGRVEEDIVLSFGYGVAKFQLPAGVLLKAEMSLFRALAGGATAYLAEPNDSSSSKTFLIWIEEGMLEMTNSVTNETILLQPNSGAYVKGTGVTTVIKRISKDEYAFLHERTKI